MLTTGTGVSFRFGDGDNVGLVDISGLGVEDDGLIEDVPDDDIIYDSKRSPPFVSDDPNSSVDWFPMKSTLADSLGVETIGFAVWNISILLGG